MGAGITPITLQEIKVIKNCKRLRFFSVVAESK